MAVVFLNSFHGAANFVCIGGQFSGKQISVRFLNRTWHEQQWLSGTFRHLTREQFDAQILGAIGIVHASGQPVSAGLVCEINANLTIPPAPAKQARPSYLERDLCTGIQNPLGGWRRMDLIEQDRLFPCSIGEDDDSVMDSAPIETIQREAVPVLR
ncbi:hypothetical protein [Ottowia sp.]|uniref:hypothetical protein n=1 Tax=Ottowia sp. TaxID=1898956 RepID=UPI0025FADF7B|nr:hypothetical protein [Ottowia sp.]MBK6616169.1 hypothetical protein [Ottowia sp.]